MSCGCGLSIVSVPTPVWGSILSSMDVEPDGAAADHGAVQFGLELVDSRFDDLGSFLHSPLDASILALDVVDRLLPGLDGRPPRLMRFERAGRQIDHRHAGGKHEPDEDHLVDPPGLRGHVSQKKLARTSSSAKISRTVPMPRSIAVVTKRFQEKVAIRRAASEHERGQRPDDRAVGRDRARSFPTEDLRLAAAISIIKPAGAGVKLGNLS